MLNQVILVGRIAKDLELNETENGKKVTNITLSVERPFKNVNGEYDIDFFDCRLFNGIAEHTAEDCKKGDLVGIRGRLQNDNNKIIVVAEKVTYLSNRKEEE